MTSFFNTQVSECEQLLLRYPERWEELLWLYYSKGLHQKALQPVCTHMDS